MTIIVRAKEVVVVIYFQVLTQDLLGSTESSHKKPHGSQHFGCGFIHMYSYLTSSVILAKQYISPY
jgi:hypothetical protein